MRAEGDSRMLDASAAAVILQSYLNKKTENKENILMCLLLSY